MLTIIEHIKLDITLELLNEVKTHFPYLTILTDHNRRWHDEILTLKLVQMNNYDDIAYIRLRVRDKDNTKIIFLIDIDTKYKAKSQFDSQVLIGYLLDRYKNLTLNINQTFNHSFDKLVIDKDGKKHKVEYLDFVFEFTAEIKFDHHNEYYFSDSQYIANIQNAVIDNFAYIEGIVDLVRYVEEKYGEQLDGL